MESSQGIVIRTRKLTESSLIVTWCTLEVGLLKTVVKGARRKGSSFASQLDLFAEGELLWQRSGRSELHGLREFHLRNLRAPLRGDYARTVVSAYFGELIERAVEPESAAPEIYDLLQRGLNFLTEGGECERALPFFEKELAQLLGLGRQAGHLLRLESLLAGGFPQSRKEALNLTRKHSS